MQIGLVHPGQMGVTLGASLVASGHRVLWASQGRSVATKARADIIGLRDVVSVDALAGNCDAIISVCPPGEAVNVAAEFSDIGYAGFYLDANAVAPQTAAQIAQQFDERYIDGGIIGPPAVTAGTTRLYLSGALATTAADWFCAGALEAIAMDSAGCEASALKMAYASYTKGHSALLLATLALASANGVDRHLQAEFDLSQPSLNKRAAATAQATAPKAWRFAPEMEEIAATYATSQLPAGFHTAAAEVYQRMAQLKHADTMDLSAVLSAIIEPPATDAQSSQQELVDN